MENEIGALADLADLEEDLEDLEEEVEEEGEEPVDQCDDEGVHSVKPSITSASGLSPHLQSHLVSPHRAVRYAALPPVVHIPI
jgi:hypothetical protein